MPLLETERGDKGEASEAECKRCVRGDWEAEDAAEAEGVTVVMGPERDDSIDIRRGVDAADRLPFAFPFSLDVSKLTRVRSPDTDESFL